MPRYSVDDKVYNIPEDKEQAFLKKFPNAKLKIDAPFKMHDGTEDPETHPEGNEVDVTTTDPSDTSNTGSESEDISSDSQKTEDKPIGDVLPEVEVQESRVLSFDEFIIAAQDRPEEMASDYSPEKELRDKLKEFHGEDSSFEFDRGIQFPGFGKDDIIITNKDGEETRIVLPTRKTDLQDITFTQAYKEYYQAVTGEEFDENDQQTIVDASQEMYDLYGKKNFHHDGTYADFMAEIKPIYQESKYVTYYDEKGRKKSRRVKGSTTISGVQRMDDGTFVDLRNPQVMTMVDGKSVTNYEPITQARIDEFYRKMFMYEESEKAKKILGNSLISEKQESASDVTENILNNKGNTNEQTLEFQEDLTEELKEEAIQLGLTEEEIQNNVMTTVDLLNYVDDKNDLALQKTKEAYEQRVADGTFTGTFDEYKEIAYDQEKLNSDFSNYIEPAYAEFNTYYEQQYADLIQANEEAITNSIDQELEPELLDFQLKIKKKSQKIVDKKAKEISNRLNKEVEDLVKSGEFGPQPKTQEELDAITEKANKWLNENFKKEIDAVIEQVNSDQEIEFSEFEVEYNKKRDELWKLKTKEVASDLNENMANAWNVKVKELQNEYMQQWNPGTTTIPDSVVASSFTRLSRDGFAQMTTENKNMALSIEWEAVERGLIESGVSADEVQIMKEEYFYKAYEKLAYDADGQKSSAELVNSANKAIQQLDKIRKENGSLDSEEQEAYDLALEIIDAPEKMSGLGLRNFYMGLADANLADYIPIVGDVVDLIDKRAIKKITDKPVEERSEGEKLMLKMYVSNAQMQSKASSLSNAYASGFGLSSSIRMMAEFALMYTPAGWASKGVKLGINSINKLGLTYLAKYGDDVLKAYSKSSKGFNLTAKLEKKFPILGSVKNPKLIIDPNGATAKTLQFLAGTTTMTTIGTPRVIGNTYAGMTPEMAISYSEVGGTYVEVINEISEGQSFKEAFAKEYGKEWVQFASERFGAYLPGISKYIKGATGLDALDNIGARMFIGRFMKKFGIKPNDTVAFINKVQERGGWNGMIGEMMEEIIAQPPTNLIDGRPLTEGMDADFYEQTFISTAAIQGMFGTLKLAGRAKSFINNKISKPKYQVGKVTYDTAEEAYEAAKKMKENGELTADTKIVIKRDFEAYDQMSELLEGTDIEIETNNAQLEINDRTAANEIEAISMLDPDQVKTVEDNKKKLEEITNKWKNSELNRDSKEYQDDKALFQSLQEQNNEILDPVLAKINERQSAEDLKKGTSLIQRWKDKLKLDNINIVSVPREQARDLAIDGIIEDSLNQVSLDRINTEVQTFVNAETGKRMFVDSRTGVEISNKQLLDAGIDYNAIVQEAQNNVDDFKTTHGFTTPMKNGRQTIVINKESAINMGRGNVAAHEFMHVLLNKTFANNPETALAVGRALESYLLNIDPKNVRNTDFRRRLEGYRASQGEIVAAEETLTLFSDALANGEIKFNETTFTKIGDIIRRAFSAIGVRVNFDSAEDVFNFVRDYNNTVAKGKNLSAGMRRTMAQGARVSGEIAYGSREYDRLLKELGYMQSAESRMSKEDGDLKSDFDQYTLNEDGTPKYNTQEEFKQSEDYYNAYTQIVDSTSLDGIIKRGMTEFGLKGAALDEFTRKVKEEIGLRYLGKINKKTGERGRGFDIVATNGSLFGWLTGVAGGQGKSIIFRAKGDVMNQYKKDKGGETVSLDKNIGDGATFGDMLIDEGNNMINTFEQENLSHTEARGQAVIPGVFASAFGLNMETISNAITESNVTSTGLAYVDAKKAVSDVQKVKNKKGKLVVPTKSSDVVPTGPLFNIMEIVAAKFGVPASRVLANQTLSNSLRIKAQNAIKENWKDLRDLALPEGETVSGQSTLVANTGLGAFYNKGERISMKQSGSAVGKEAQTKRTDITKEQFWAEFGINPDGSFMSGTKFDNNIRELIKQAAAITANQGVRMNDIKSGTAETAAVALFGDGRSALAFSKEFRGLSPAKQTLFISEIPQISALVNPSLKDVADWKEVRDILVSVFKGEIPASTLGGIAKDIVKMAKYFKPVADSVLDEDGFKWGNYVANNFTEEADNIVKLLNIKLFNIKSRKQLKGSDLYDDIDLVSDARKTPSDIGKALLNTINPKTGVNYTLTEVARVMAILKPMYAGATQIGRGKFKVDKNGKLYEVTPDQLMKDGKPRTEYSDQRYQVFDSAADFMKWGVLQIPGMTQDIYDAANTKLMPQNSKHAVEKGSYEDSLAEATEVREVINMALNVVGNNDVHLAMFMVSANSSMKSPIRRAANLRYIADSVKKMNPKQLGSLAEYEHMIPANYMAIKIIQEHKKGGIKDINEFYKDYTVAVIPKTMDDVLKAQGLQSLMNASYQFGVDPSWFRYYNSLTIPFAELETIRDISTGELIGEPYTRIEIDKKIENAKKYTKARNNALSLKKSAEPQGMSTFDFDDTLAFTKSGIRLTRPNTTGKSQPGRKAILIAGNAGAGKTTVINQLGLRKQGFKYVNQDIALDWLTKNNGLPKDMNEFTREQSQKWRDLQGEAAVAAKNKASKLRGKGDGVVIDGTGAVGVQFQDMARKFKEAGYDVQIVFVESSLETALERNANRSERRLTDATVRNAHEATQKNKKAFKEMVSFFPYSAKGFVEINTDNLRQGESLPAEFVKTMDNFTKGYIKERINAEEFAAKGADLLANGAEFDFSEFNKVVDGTPGPLLQKMKNQVKKYGSENVYVLTARPAESAGPIQQFLKDQGVNIPLKNITGLGNSTGEAKAQWFVQKYAEGYNDMYFVDDALSNVKAVKRAFDALDVKGKSVQARINFSKEFSDTFNQMLEQTKGVGAQKTFSRVEARRRGKNKGRFTFFVPPSAEDFAGLLRYFAGAGAQGNADIKFFEEALIKPFARADRAMSQQKQAIRDDYKALQKEFPSVKKMLGKLTDGGKYTYDMAVRVYLFDKAGYDIPGISNLARINMINLVKQNQELRAYADALGKISRQEQGYLEPTENWDVENIAFDLQNATSRIGRKQFLAEFLENKDIIFSPDNLNKIEAIYGSNFRSALEDILYRMETGQNRRRGATKFENSWNNWINNSVGAIMFFNARSAVLQTLSTVNFVNFEDNNVFAAGRAFANQKQYWSDFSFLFNSDFLRNRRAGLATNVNEAELANAVAGATNKAKAALGYLLKIGFTPTQIADSFAISSGGATFYRNRVNTYLKQGMSQAEAESQAFLDFQEIAEETQQSARPDKISQQQASNLGRIILAFANTPMQYNRLIKKAAGDLINGRGDWRSNISRIAYYGAIQNFIFAAMQNALFALAFDDDEELTESQQAARDRTEDTKNSRILNSMFDSLARGSGIYGAALATLKNAIMKYMEEDAKGWRADYAQVVIEALNVSPPLGSKARKLYSAGRTRKFSRDVMSEMSMLDYDNPAWQAIGNVVEATTNIPMARAIRKIDNIREALNKDNSNMQRMMLFLGWSAWDLNVGTEVIKNEGKENEYVVTLDTKRMNQLKVEQELDAKKAKERKQQAEKKRQEKKEQEAKENEQQIKENIEKQKKEGEDATCAAISSKGNRCKRKPVKDGFCTVHEKVEQNKTGEKKQCKHIKPDGKRCKMKTNSKSGNCYYHD